MHRQSTLNACGTKKLQQQRISPEFREVSLKQTVRDPRHQRVVSDGWHERMNLINVELPRQEQWKGHLLRHHSKLPVRHTDVL